jgi:hypothetical protein
MCSIISADTDRIRRRERALAGLLVNVSPILVERRWALRALGSLVGAVFAVV